MKCATDVFLPQVVATGTALLARLKLYAVTAQATEIAEQLVKAHMGPASQMGMQQVSKLINTLSTHLVDLSEELLRSDSLTPATTAAALARKQGSPPACCYCCILLAHCQRLSGCIYSFPRLFLLDACPSLLGVWLQQCLEQSSSHLVLTCEIAATSAVSSSRQ